MRLYELRLRSVHATRRIFLDNFCETIKSCRCPIFHQCEPMAKLLQETFPLDNAGQALLKSVKRALTNLTGVGDNPSNIYLPAPIKLNAERDNLRDDYRSIWQACKLKFEIEQTGAEMAAGNEMEIGPYFLRASTTVTDMEKIILHEFLHNALEPSGIGGSTGYEFDHTRINEIIRDNLKYPGPPNPANPSED